MTQPSQNAFDRLFTGGLKFSQSQKPNTGKRRRSAADQQAKYTTCPVCQGSYPTAFVASHVSDCLSKSTQKPSQTRTSAAVKHNPPPAGAAAAAARSNHSSTAAHGGFPGTAAKPQQARDAAIVNSNAKRHAAASQLLQQQFVVDADGTTKPNAYARLAAGQAATVPLEAHMFLEALSDGSWACHWWNEGAVCPKQGLQTAWSATANADLPKLEAKTTAGSSSSSRESDILTGRTTMRVHLATNLPSGFGAKIDWDNLLLPSNHQPVQPLQQQAVLPSMAAGQPSQQNLRPAGGAPRWHGSKGALISALQKCIRRGLAASATRLALALLKDADTALALLRRLSIICLEDGLLHPQLPLVVWTMMAVGKGYVVGGSLANALLAITYQMSAVGHRDFLPEPDQINGPVAAIYQAPRTWDALDAVLAPASPGNLLVKCILIRAGFGGMAGDKDMLLRFAGLWLSRFRGIILPPPQLPQQRTAALVLQQQQQPQQQQQQQVPVHLPPQQQVPDQAQQPQQQQQHDVVHSASQSLPGRKGPASCAAAAAAVTAGDSWLLFLRAAYSDLRPPGTAGAAAETCHVTRVAPLQRDDIPVAAIDFHTSKALTGYLLQHPALQAAITGLCSSNASVRALYNGPDGAEQLIKSAMWLFRSSLNRKAWLQHCYLLPEQREKVQQAHGYAQQVMFMELDALKQDDNDRRLRRQQLMPIWKAMAGLADAWAKDHINKQLF